MSSIVLVYLTELEPSISVQIPYKTHFCYFFGNSNNLLLPPNLVKFVLMLGILLPLTYKQYDARLNPLLDWIEAARVINEVLKARDHRKDMLTEI